MLKNNQKRKILILLATGFFAVTLFAQQPDEAAKRALEREIKVSGNYLYGEAVGNTKDEAVKMAKTALVSEIKKEALNHLDRQFAKSIQTKDVEEYNIDMIDLMRGKKFRVIAYIKKDNIAAVFDNKKSEVKLTDKKVQQEKVQPVTQQQMPPATVVDSRMSTDGLLKQIVNASSIREVQKILVENKKVGKVAYGTMDKLTAPEKAYLVVYKKSGEIVAILDKGSIINRKDLLSGETKGNELSEQNQVIWFQLF